VLATGQAQLLSFGVADETAWSVGLACGGQISVLVEPLSAELYTHLRTWLAADEAGVVATVIAGEGGEIGRKLFIPAAGSPSGSIDPTHDGTIIQAALAALATRTPQTVAVPGSDQVVFCDVLLPEPQLIIVGAVHIARSLVTLAREVGFRPIVIDPRRAFATPERFPDVRLLAEWPRQAFPKLTLTPATAVVLLTHDPKIDDQALAHLLESGVFYIGALGGRKTAQQRVARLEAQGYSAGAIGRIHAPVGLPINAATPAEIALAIMAEIIAAWRGGGHK
jgi:xanthine dehydrogenase accessory factor